MGTLYVVGVPAGAPDDVTRRTLRVLGEVALVVAQDVDWARRLLARHDIATPLTTAPFLEAALGTLETADVALLAAGWSLGPSGSGRQLVCAALASGLPVVPIPGPSLPITALVLSGLPADSFVYLGELPPEPLARRELLASVGVERRTLVVLAWPERAFFRPDAVLYEALGDRPLVVVTASERGTRVLWRGTLDQVPNQIPGRQAGAPLVFVIGGARQQAVRWEEARLRAEIESGLEQDLGAKEISKRLAAESGWPRREIYRLVVKMH